MVESHRRRVLVFEHRREALLPRHLFLRRMARSTALSLAFVAGSLALGNLSCRTPVLPPLLIVLLLPSFLYSCSAVLR